MQVMSFIVLCSFAAVLAQSNETSAEVTTAASAMNLDESSPLPAVSASNSSETFVDSGNTVPETTGSASLQTSSGQSSDRKSDDDNSSIVNESGNNVDATKQVSAVVTEATNVVGSGANDNHEGVSGNGAFTYSALTAVAVHALLLSF